jgi:hypothetical protein
VVFDKDKAWNLATTLAITMATSITEYADEGLDELEIKEIIESSATPGFSCEVKESGEDKVSCSFYPSGEPEWVMSVEGVMQFIQGVTVLAAKKGWSLEATDMELKILKPFLAGVEEVPFPTDGED